MADVYIRWKAWVESAWHLTNTAAVVLMARGVHVAGHEVLPVHVAEAATVVHCRNASLMLHSTRDSCTSHRREVCNTHASWNGKVAIRLLLLRMLVMLISEVASVASVLLIPLWSLTWWWVTTLCAASATAR